MIGIGWKRRESKSKSNQEKSGDSRKRRTAQDRKRKKRTIAVPEEDDALSKAKVSLTRYPSTQRDCNLFLIFFNFSGKPLVKAEADALVEGIKSGKKDGVALFRRVLQQYSTSRVRVLCALSLPLPLIISFAPLG
jgi:hypothetical protein